LEANKKIHSVALVLAVLTLFLILISSTAWAASPKITETRFTASAQYPAIYGDRIMWRSINMTKLGIYMYNLSTSKETQITKSNKAENPDIYGDNIVWRDDRNNDDNGNYNIYMYDLSTSKETQITTSGTIDIFGNAPAIYGNMVVWADYRNSNQSSVNIYMYDLSTSKETQITTSGKAEDPDIYGDRIVWMDYRNGNLDIYMYNISTKNETQITTNESGQFDPQIYGDRIVWTDMRNGNYDIYLYNVSTNKETQITSGRLAGSPATYGDRIVWEEQHDISENLTIINIYMYDLSTGKETQITTNKSYKVNPTIYDNRILWEEDELNEGHDIYMATLSSESLIADFSVSSNTGNAPLNVTFTDKSIGSPYAWKWDFGDGANSTQQNPTHTYSKAGNYTVTLTISNTDGMDTNTSEMNIQSAFHPIPDGSNFLIFVMTVLYLWRKST
jgi:beta propeller repeat protein